MVLELNGKQPCVCLEPQGLLKELVRRHPTRYESHLLDN